MDDWKTSFSLILICIEIWFPHLPNGDRSCYYDLSQFRYFLQDWNLSWEKSTPISTKQRDHMLNKCLQYFQIFMNWLNYNNTNPRLSIRKIAHLPLSSKFWETAEDHLFFYSLFSTTPLRCRQGHASLDPFFSSHWSLRACLDYERL